MLKYGFKFSFYMVLMRIGNIFVLRDDMSLQNMLIFSKICLIFLKSEPKYAYKRYAYKKNSVYASR